MFSWIFVNWQNWWYPNLSTHQGKTTQWGSVSGICPCHLWPPHYPTLTNRRLSNSQIVAYVVGENGISLWFFCPLWQQHNISLHESKIIGFYLHDFSIDNVLDYFQFFVIINSAAINFLGTYIFTQLLFYILRINSVFCYLSPDCLTLG